MKKLLALPFLVPLIVSGGPPLAAALWGPAVALLPLTFIVSLAARKRPWTTLFFLNLALVIVIGVIGAVAHLHSPNDLDPHGQTSVGGSLAARGEDDNR